jgi:hypothetical protein
MKSRIRGRDAAWAAVRMAERRPVPLQATDLVGPFQPAPVETTRKRPPRVRKPSSGHDAITAIAAFSVASSKISKWFGRKQEISLPIIVSTNWSDWVPLNI